MSNVLEVGEGGGGGGNASWSTLDTHAKVKRMLGNDACVCVCTAGEFFPPAVAFVAM